MTEIHNSPPTNTSQIKTELPSWKVNVRRIFWNAFHSFLNVFYICKRFCVTLEKSLSESFWFRLSLQIFSFSGCVKDVLLYIWNIYSQIIMKHIYLLIYWASISPASPWTKRRWLSCRWQTEGESRGHWRGRSRRTSARTKCCYEGRGHLCSRNKLVNWLLR